MFVPTFVTYFLLCFLALLNTDSVGNYLSLLSRMLLTLCPGSPLQGADTSGHERSPARGQGRALPYSDMYLARVLALLSRSPTQQQES